MQMFAKYLIQLQMIYDCLLTNLFKHMTFSLLTKCLKNYEKSKPGGIPPLAEYLTSKEHSSSELATKDVIWGKRIIQTYDIFKGEEIKRWNLYENEDTRTIRGVLKLMTASDGSTNLDALKSNLHQQYKIFETEYDSLVDTTIHEWKADKSVSQNIQGLVRQTQLLGQEIRQMNPVGVDFDWSTFWDKKDKKGRKKDKQSKVTRLMAHVLAIWVLQPSKYFFDNKQQQQKGDVDEKKNSESGAPGGDRSYLLRPRIPQVVSMMRLLSLGNKETAFVKNLVQIGTGEGKSLVLAAVACVLSLIGFDVYVASYGRLLTTRDNNAFADLFRVLGVSKHVHYKTLAELNRAMFGNGMDVEQEILKLISQTSNFEHGTGESTSQPKQDSRRKMLLIDEVDTLFDSSTFGKMYNPAFNLKHSCISDMLDLVWKHHKPKNDERDDDPVDESKDKEAVSPGFNSLEELRSGSFKEYGNCVNVFGETWMPLVDNHINEMINHAKNFESHKNQYVVYHGRIGYRDNTFISTSTTYGYLTTFAYYYENEKGKISDHTLSQVKTIHFRYAQLSYSELPTKFDSIVGVTATLNTLTKEQESIVQTKYGISEYTFMPSVFKQNSFYFDEKNDVSICSLDQFSSKLTQEIEKWRKYNPGEKGGQPTEQEYRPVMVFFKDGDVLKKFYDSDQFSGDLKNKCILLTEELTHNEKEQVTKDACRLNAILLATKIFGRGTDFQVNDDEVEEIGGSHVIQTFFSDEISEETQIKGRTARHGGNGSYSMLLIEEEVELSKEDLENAMKEKKVYPILEEKRKELTRKLYTDIHRKIENAKKMHYASEECVKVLESNNTARVRDLLLAMQS